MSILNKIKTAIRGYKGNGKADPLMLALRPHPVISQISDRLNRPTENARSVAAASADLGGESRRTGPDSDDRKQSSPSGTQSPSKAFPGHSPMQMSQTSALKRESNRRNATLSTGPKTARGKSNARKNAFKHGLFAEEIVVTLGDAKESLEEFRSLLAQLEKEHAPVGCLETLQVEKIAKCIWRLRRVSRHEAGQILGKTGNTTIEACFKRSDELMAYRKTPGVFHNELRQSSMGVASLIALLELADDELRSGFLSPDTFKQLFDYFGRLAELTEHEEAINDYLGKSEDKDHQESLNESKMRLLNWIGRNVEALRLALPVLRERDFNESEALIALRCIPDAPLQVLRLEKKVEKDLNTAVEALEKLQAARRRKELVAAEVN